MGERPKDRVHHFGLGNQHEKLVHGFKVLMDKNYIDNLSEEVIKGMQEKASQGHWPSWAPIGYRNNADTKLIELDTLEAPLVRKLFEEAAADPAPGARPRGSSRSGQIAGRVHPGGKGRPIDQESTWAQ